MRRKAYPGGGTTVYINWFSPQVTTNNKYRLPLVMGVGDVPFIPKDTQDEEDRKNMGSFQEFSRRNRIRCEAPDGFNHPLGSWSTSDWMTAFIGEAGEAANLIKKLNRLRDGIQNKKGETEEQLHADLRGELADAFTYLDLLAQALGFDILEAAEQKFVKVSDEIGYDSVRPFGAPVPAPAKRFVVNTLDAPPPPIRKGDRWIDTGMQREWEFDGTKWVIVPDEESRFPESPLKTIADDMAAGTATFGQSGPATLAEYEGGGGGVAGGAARRK